MMTPNRINRFNDRVYEKEFNQFYRPSGPVIESIDGSRTWDWTKERIDGPVTEYPDGYRSPYK